MSNSAWPEKKEDFYRVRIQVSGPEKPGTWEMARTFDGEFIRLVMDGEPFASTEFESILGSMFEICANQDESE